MNILHTLHTNIETKIHNGVNKEIHNFTINICITYSILGTLWKALHASLCFGHSPGKKLSDISCVTTLEPNLRKHSHKRLGKWREKHNRHKRGKSIKEEKQRGNIRKHVYIYIQTLNGSMLNWGARQRAVWWGALGNDYLARCPRSKKEAVQPLQPDTCWYQDNER